MCGICGIVYADPAHPVDLSRLTRMRDILRHRGPDDAGTWVDRGVGLAHRRLSIIDLTTAGRQPMANEDGTVWVTYNGEVYNFADLRTGLRRAGHHLKTKTDTEVLVHLYEDERDALVHRLRGMFAFGLWDVRRRRLLLVRDRLGIKPLYYAVTGGGDLVFGSEIKAVLASGLVQRQYAPAALSEYLANRYTTGTETLFGAVRRLPPGHFAVWQDGKLVIEQYWTYPVEITPTQKRDDGSLVEEFSERFQESVGLRMISDAPIGVFLSGGVDSSAIAAVMARRADAPIRTFSVAFHEREANELRYAREVAARVGAEHQEVVLTPDDFIDLLPRMVWHEDEPIAFPSSIPLYAVSALAASSVKVVLTGEGSDELLAGYGKYWRALYNLRAANVYRHLPSALRGWVRSQIAALPERRWSNRLARTFLHQAPSVEGLYLQSFSVFNTGRQVRLLTPEFLETVRNGHPLDPYAGHRHILDALPPAHTLNHLLALDIATYLQELLMKQDQMSMAASIESRVPFLDHHLVEFAASLPIHLKLRGTHTKRVLRLAAHAQVPPSVLRRSKWGFPTPLGAWLRGPHTQLLDDIVLSPRALQRGIFQSDEVRRLVREHREARMDHTERLWALLMTELWFRSCVEGERTW